MERVRAGPRPIAALASGSDDRSVGPAAADLEPRPLGAGHPWRPAARGPGPAARPHVGSGAVGDRRPHRIAADRGPEAHADGTRRPARWGAAAGSRRMAPAAASGPRRRSSRWGRTWAPVARAACGRTIGAPWP